MSDVFERFKSVREKVNISQGKMADILKTSQSVISAIEIGDREPSKQILINLKNEFNININWLLTGEGEMYNNSITSIIRIPILDQKASAGYGVTGFDHPAILGYFELDKEVTKKYKNPVFVQVSGDSMEPTLRDGDYVAIAPGTLDSNGLYVININGNILVKRLQFIRREKILIKSDNKLYDTEEVGPEMNEHFSIIGKVFYRLGKI